ncbi:lysophospholipid acyltransferase family protein [Dyadobacter sandarakinus]|uniref:Lysophospholipid acyltransferase family protein n=1 Tax=Dyadobacter sandarakinus TaxID=2747268 RepID=A0ABX7I3D6_9BACT|nr:lysophospholipid acyltransferase family protein [Dyadobacter sandarakinus]QRR00253.1 lysophospholipid acyltransferase family protein [Dyadobacter sandarakinus]
MKSSSFSNPQSPRPPVSGLPRNTLQHIAGEVLLLVGKLLALLIFVLLRYVLAYRKQLIIQNLTTSFPSKSAAEINTLMHAYYWHMSDLVIEPFLFYAAPATLRGRLATYTNPELLEKLYRMDKQVIVFASHYGNWEYLIGLPQKTSYDVYTAYSPIKNRRIDMLMVGLRSFMGVKLIPKQGFYRQALSLLRQSGLPKLLVIIADQRPAPGSNKFHIPFLDQDTAVQTGGERMVASSDATVVYVEAHKSAQFKYEFTFSLMENADPAIPMGITKAYYRILENSIWKSPSYWLWSHNRWKMQPGEMVQA